MATPAETPRATRRGGGLGQLSCVYKKTRLYDGLEASAETHWMAMCGLTNPRELIHAGGSV